VKAANRPRFSGEARTVGTDLHGAEAG
jgi:hypothetical protein